MEFSIYLDPFDPEELELPVTGSGMQLGNEVVFAGKNEYPDNLNGFDLAIIGVNESRRSLNNQGCSLAPDHIRNFLYRLAPLKEKIKMIDLGNIKKGEQVSDTYFALKQTLGELLQSGTMPLVLGGSQDLTYSMYLAFEETRRIINMVEIDSRIDHRQDSEMPDASSYLSHIILRKPNFLFNYANLGYQSYFVDSSLLRLFDDLYFDAYRLGKVRENLSEAEPVLRNADLLSVDMGAIRQSDAPGTGNASPNGFYGEEICQLMRYAGISSKLSALGFFELNPGHDHNGQTAHLAAQMIWYFLEGYINRTEDFPKENSKGFMKYIVDAQGNGDDMVFYKSKQTDRWWMQLPVSKNKAKEYARHIMVPCSYSDYQQACNQEIPDRWWKAYQKLM